MRSEFMDAVLSAVSTLGNLGAIWIAAALLFVSTRKYRVTGLTMLAALLAGAIIGNVILKPLVARTRPCDVNMAVELLLPRPKDFSFPSGHTLSSFAAATVIFLRDRRLGTAAVITACVMSFSRLYLYVHYPSDVLAGALIGVAVGVCTSVAADKLAAKTPFLQPGT